LTSRHPDVASSTVSTSGASGKLAGECAGTTSGSATPIKVMNRLPAVAVKKESQGCGTPKKYPGSGPGGAPEPTNLVNNFRHSVNPSWGHEALPPGTKPLDSSCSAP